jgi:hypothetical protein
MPSCVHFAGFTVPIVHHSEGVDFRVIQISTPILGTIWNSNLDTNPGHYLEFKPQHHQTVNTAGAISLMRVEQIMYIFFS